MTSERQLLIVERRFRIDQQDNDLGQADRLEGLADRKLLDRIGDLGATADTRGIHEADRAILVAPVDMDGVAGDAGIGPRQHAVFADEAIDQSRLAGVRTADDGHLERAIGVIERDCWRLVGVVVVFIIVISARRREA